MNMQSSITKKSFWLAMSVVIFYAATFLAAGEYRKAFFGTYRFPIQHAYQAPQDGGVDQTEFAYLAENLLAKHTFTLSNETPHIPETWRTPGYPAFIAFWLLITKSYMPVMLAQILIVALTAIL